MIALLGMIPSAALHPCTCRLGLQATTSGTLHVKYHSHTTSMQIGFYSRVSRPFSLCSKRQFTVYIPYQPIPVHQSTYLWSSQPAQSRRTDYLGSSSAVIYDLRSIFNIMHHPSFTFNRTGALWYRTSTPHPALADCDRSRSPPRGRPGRRRHRLLMYP